MKSINSELEAQDSNISLAHLKCIFSSAFWSPHINYSQERSTLPSYKAVSRWQRFFHTPCCRGAQCI